MPGYYYGGENTAYTYLENKETGELKLVYFNNNWYSDHIKNNTADGTKRYRRWDLGGNGNGDATTITLK